MAKNCRIAQEFPILAEEIESMHRRIAGAIQQLNHNLSGLRSGRPSPTLLEEIRVEVYGNMQKVKEIASISISEPRTLVVKVWDRSIAKNVEKAIREAALGLNPIAEGDTIRVPVPELSGDQRKIMVRKAGEYAEDAKIAIRNIRRDVIDHVKKLEKQGEMSKDDAKSSSGKVQTEIDARIAEVEQIHGHKVTEVSG